MDQAYHLRRAVLEHLTSGSEESSHCRMVAFASGRRGVGTTSILANIAVELDSIEGSICLVDSDFRRVDLVRILGASLEAYSPKPLDVWPTAARPTPMGPHVLSFASDVADLTAQRTQDAVPVVESFRKARSPFRWLLVDVGMLEDPFDRAWCWVADQVVFVTTPDALAVLDTYSAMKRLLTECPQGLRGARWPHRMTMSLALNQSSSVAEASTIAARLVDSADRFLGCRLRFLGAIPFDRRFYAAESGDQPFPAAGANEPILAAPAATTNRPCLIQSAPTLDVSIRLKHIVTAIRQSGSLPLAEAKDSRPEGENRANLLEFTHTLCR